jgi:hypothetical protein
VVGGHRDKFDPDATVPMPAARTSPLRRQVHYDGAKDEETVIEVHGIAAASKPAEKKP